MSDGSDFASFVVARWPVLVRSLVLLAHEPARADEAAVAGLVRCQPSWDRVRDEGDVDVHVYRVVLEQVERGEHERVADHDPAPLPLLDPVLADRSERVELLAALESALAKLPTEERTVLVLRFAADLEPDQVGAVLARPTPVVQEQERRGLVQLARGAEWARLREGGFEPSEVFLDAGEVIPLRNPPVDDVVARAGVARQRRRKWAAGAAAAAVVVLGASTWLGTRPSGPQLPESVVTRAQNPANIEWYANRELHLPDVTVELPQISDMVPVADSVVYGDEDGLVVQVRRDGSLVKIGETTPDKRVVGSDERGWAAWVQPGDTGDRLVVRDVVRGEVVASHPVAKGATPVAIDGDSVLYTTPGRDWRWQPVAPAGVEPTWTPGGDLLDVASGVRVSQAEPGRIHITQPLFDVEVDVPGNGAILRNDGDYLLTEVDEPDPHTVVLYDAASGDPVDVGLGREEVAVQAAFDAEGAAVFLVELRANAPEPGQELRLSATGPTIMRSCEYEFFEPECRTETQFASNAGEPLLPH
ncbi:MAG: sigma factor-like helix-turn-helix DNA-binding protein [Nocardioides sp.]